MGEAPSDDNYSANGSARLSSVRSWLSQWSVDDSLADGPKRLAETSVPVLSINFTQDEIVFPSDVQVWRAAMGRRGEHHEIADCGHYPMKKPAIVDQVADMLAAWARRTLG